MCPIAQQHSMGTFLVNMNDLSIWKYSYIYLLKYFLFKNILKYFFYKIIFNIRILKLYENIKKY